MNVKEKKINAGIFSICCAFVMTFAVTFSGAQSLNDNWENELKQALEQFKNCDDTDEQGVSPCNKFVGNALKTVYKVNDFYSESSHRYMLISEISDFVSGSDKWTMLGPAYDQNALKRAQDLANSKKAVVAVYLDENNIGHVSLVLPGSLKKSGIWGFEVPNSASFFTGEPENSYVGKSLSYAFGRRHIKDVKLYARNY